MRTGNPVLKEDTFTRSDLERDDTSSVMTLQGAVLKTAVAVAIVVAAATFTYAQTRAGVPPVGWIIGGAIGGLVLGLITAFKPTAAPYTTPIYAACEGLLLGGVSAMYEMQYHGIVLNAVGLTLGTLVALLAAYTSGLIKVTDNLRLGIVAATGGICLMFFVTFILNMCGIHVPYIYDAGPIGIGISLVIVVIAALNLVLDFDFIEKGVEHRAPKYMEWYAAFGLLVTLVWLYLEILRLLAKLPVAVQLAQLELMRRTKILATLGPASSEPAMLDRMIAAGLDAVRLNFSHGTHESHARAYGLVREAAARAGRPIAVLQDVQGPKIRVGVVRGDGMDVPTGSTLVITTRDIEGADGVVSTSYAALPGDVTKGQRILLDDGNLIVVVREVRGQDVVCDVVDGGRLGSHKGLSVPGATLTTAAMTEKDAVDARFGLALGVDLIALSFVRTKDDVLALRALMREVGRTVPIVAKIEKPQGVENLDAILEVADGVMVARGDLAIEVSLEMIPVLQKQIIRQANARGRLVITATQMLESMTENPLPTRAEVTDVANAVLDGTDAVMLSGETAVGKFPAETVARMASVAETAEEHAYPFDRAVRVCPAACGDVGSGLARLAGHAARELAPAALVVMDDAAIVRLLSDERPRAPVIFFSGDEATRHQLALYWGILPRARTADNDTVDEALRALRTEGLVHPGDRVIVVGDRRAPDAVRIVDLPDA